MPVQIIDLSSIHEFVAHDFKGLRYLQEEVGKKFIKGIILYTGTEYIPFGHNLFALPIAMLWQK